MTMMFPCMLTAGVAALGFLLPVESGEKVALEITVLLSLAVFLLLVSESLPPSSEDFPIIGKFKSLPLSSKDFPIIRVPSALVRRLSQHR